jgi:hypothetical protein
MSLSQRDRESRTRLSKMCSESSNRRRNSSRIEEMKSLIDARGAVRVWCEE